MTTLYFVRHAQSDRTVRDGRIRPLTPQGVKDAAHLVTLFQGISIDAILSSPFQRAMDTVRPLAEERQLEIEVVEAFQERRSDSQQAQDLAALTREQWLDFTYTLSDGECFQEVQNRNLAALAQVLANHPEETVVIGTHGVALCTMLHRYCPMNVEAFDRILQIMPYVVKLELEAGACVSMLELEVK